MKHKMTDYYLFKTVIIVTADSTRYFFLIDIFSSKKMVSVISGRKEWKNKNEMQ